MEIQLGVYFRFLITLMLRKKILHSIGTGVVLSISAYLLLQKISAILVISFCSISAINIFIADKGLDTFFKIHLIDKKKILLLKTLMCGSVLGMSIFLIDMTLRK